MTRSTTTSLAEVMVGQLEDDRLKFRQLTRLNQRRFSQLQLARLARVRDACCRYIFREHCKRLASYMGEYGCDFGALEGTKVSRLDHGNI